MQLVMGMFSTLIMTNDVGLANGKNRRSCLPKIHVPTSEIKSFVNWES